jgi:cytochrome c-type biogenesis protein CcmH
MPERSSRLPLWVRVAVPLAVLAVALVIGSGAFSGQPTTPAQRAAAIEGVVRCPSCDDVSVAQSEESTAIAVRHEIVHAVDAGQSTSQIENQLVAQYGPSILLEPPDAGGIAVIWGVPIVLGIGVLGVVGTLFWRRSRQFSALRNEQAAAP